MSINLADFEMPLRIEELEEEVSNLKGAIRYLEDENRVLKAKTDNRKKLTDRDVSLIRRFSKTAGATHRELAEAFEVNRATITRIINGTYHKDK